MAYNIQTAEREFVYKDKTLTDPNPAFTPEEVMDYYGKDHPELINGKITGPIMKQGKAIYNFNVKMGSKG